MSFSVRRSCAASAGSRVYRHQVGFPKPSRLRVGISFRSSKSDIDVKNTDYFISVESRRDSSWEGLQSPYSWLELIDPLDPLP
jgi:hypothetical protein